MKNDLRIAFDYALEVEKELNKDTRIFSERMGFKKEKNPYEDIRDFTISIPSTDKYRERTVSKYSIMFPGIGMSNKKRLKLNNY